VALATAEVCGDIQVKARSMVDLEQKTPSKSVSIALIQGPLTEIAHVQRRLLTSWEGAEQKSLQFSLALHNLLCAPDTLLISIQEGLQSSEMLMQLVAARYLERVLPTRPLETLELYKLLLRTISSRNVRRPVAKALPMFLYALKESSLSVRAQTRMIITELAVDPDVHIRRAVADHAMQLFSIDREFLLILLQQMQKDPDQAIRHRLRPVALRLAEVWLVWYAQTAELIDMKAGRTKVIRPFGE
jgi:3-methyladenine DNA glycosylase AlkC